MKLTEDTVFTLELNREELEVIHSMLGVGIDRDNLNSGHHKMMEENHKTICNLFDATTCVRLRY